MINLNQSNYQLINKDQGISDFLKKCDRVFAGDVIKSSGREYVVVSVGLSVSSNYSNSLFFDNLIDASIYVQKRIGEFIPRNFDFYEDGPRKYRADHFEMSPSFSLVEIKNGIVFNLPENSKTIILD